MWTKLDAMLERFSSMISYTTSGSLIICGLTVSDLAGLVGIALGLGTFIVNWYYKAKDDRRKTKATAVCLGTDDQCSGC